MEGDGGDKKSAFYVRGRCAEGDGGDMMSAFYG